MYKTYEEWKEVNCFVSISQKSLFKNKEGKALFHINQVQERLTKDELFMMNIEAECTDPNL